MGKMHIRRDDTVVVITGKDKGKKGKVLVVVPSKNRVIVEGVNIVSRHTRPTSQTNQGGIIKKEAPIDASNVMLYCSKCDKGVRVGIKLLENGEKARVCKKCGAVIGK
ncbi:MAG: 50S ribosomal protein L24 [Clostridia bacterium]|jgi:large subunit ribosomal protein L24|nr:50S ribosomal protein L24 [Clostridia bacterium]MBQ5956786.1 50S ribosomal protein L24 [Clostridia bacterium]MBQ6004145.1 50S ribosomal protein L24 [Clostridia bacterium]MBR0437753.1 50S ribosomal protein L24 [Clostridia bacterium]MBR3564527.1 50S ribosomal protein L24 [Clostridia bacterium]